MTAHYELQRIWKEMVLTYSKVLFQNLQETEEDHENLRIADFWTKNKIQDFLMQSKSAEHPTTVQCNLYCIVLCM
jgi:hypothetical protein